MVNTDVLDLLQSSGPIALNELVMRSSQEPEELVTTLELLRREGRVVISGPHAFDLEKLTADQVFESSDTVVEASTANLRRSFFQS